MSVRLETVKLGGTACTSLEALQRFFDRLSGDTTVVTPTTITRKSPQTEAAIPRASERMGKYAPRIGTRNMGKATTTTPVLGRWSIDSMSMWDKDCLTNHRRCTMTFPKFRMAKESD